MTIQYSTQDHVATIVIDNGTVNPLTPSMHRQMYDVLTEFLADANVHAGVLTGSGRRAFSAGDDMKNSYPEDDDPTRRLLAELTPQHRTASTPESWQWEYEVMALERYKPIVGAVTGWALGAGLAYLLALTDIRVAGRGARFGFPEIAYGMGGLGGTLRLTRHVPQSAALALLLTGDPIDAVEAQRIHLINEVVDDDAVLTRANAIAERIASHPPLAVRIEMEATQHASDLTRREAVHYGDRMYQLQRLAVNETETESYRRGRAISNGKQRP